MHDSLRDLIPALARRITGRDEVASRRRDFWALKDVSFTVRPGEVLGIIGPNGAGKSTTLKILNRIMVPTNGTVEVSGKVGALIEVSAGFHQDLTGRQNVFLQGAIMGMRKAEVTRKFDEIVEFAGIGDFIDTPVKRYSSGMNARLGFSIAAHLEPDVLIIDEVLAVGDHAFQQKAFGRIREMADSGIPAILVSHQLDRISELCSKTILLQNGAVRASGTSMFCINEYLHGMGRGSVGAHTGDAGIAFTSIASQHGLAVFSGEIMHVTVHGNVSMDVVPISWAAAFRVLNAETGVQVHSVIGPDRGAYFPARGKFSIEIALQMNLPPGNYLLEPHVWDLELLNDAAVGPRLQVKVMERLRFWGDAQLNSQMSVEPLAEEAPTAEDGNCR